MSADAASSNPRSGKRCDVRPNPRVNAAEPSKVPVTIAPTSTGENPRPVRYWASSTLTNPSAKPRIVRPAITRGMSGDDEPNRVRCVDGWLLLGPTGHVYAVFVTRGTEKCRRPVIELGVPVGLHLARGSSSNAG